MLEHEQALLSLVKIELSDTGLDSVEAMASQLKYKIATTID